jgi:hypothetical protein
MVTQHLRCGRRFPVGVLPILLLIAFTQGRLWTYANPTLPAGSKADAAVGATPSFTIFLPLVRHPTFFPATVVVDGRMTTPPPGGAPLETEASQIEESKEAMAFTKVAPSAHARPRKLSGKRKRADDTNTDDAATAGDADAVLLPSASPPSTPPPFASMPFASPLTLAQPAIVDGAGSCGLVVFFHINKCGGGSVNTWLKNNSPNKEDHVFRYCCTRRGEEGKETETQAGNQWHDTYFKRIEAHMEGIDKVENRWKSVTLHHGAPGLAFMHSTTIPTWRRLLAAKGCNLVLTTMLRHPLERLLSNIDFNHVHPEDVDLFAPSRANWLSRYLLYNICGPRNSTSLAMEDPVCGHQYNGAWTRTPQVLDDRLYEYLDEFDAIGFTSHMDAFLERIGALTGWGKNPGADEGKKHVHGRKKKGKPRSYSEPQLLLMIRDNTEDLRLYFEYLRGRANAVTA